MYLRQKLFNGEKVDITQIPFMRYKDIHSYSYLADSSTPRFPGPDAGWGFLVITCPIFSQNATPCLRLCLTLPIIHILLSRFGIYFKLIIFCVLNLALESTAERNAGNSRVYIQHTRFSSSNSQITKNVELEQLSWAMTRVLGLIFIVRVQDYMHIHVCMYVNINIYVHIIYIEYTVKTVLAVTFALRPPGHSGHFCRSL